MTCTNRMITTSISRESEAARSALVPTAAHPFRGCVGPLARSPAHPPPTVGRGRIFHVGRTRRCVRLQGHVHGARWRSTWNKRRLLAIRQVCPRTCQCRMRPRAASTASSPCRRASATSTVRTVSSSSVVMSSASLQQVTFEEVCALLWTGRLPTRSESEALSLEMATSRAMPGSVAAVVSEAAKRSVAPIDALRMGCAALSMEVQSATDLSRAAGIAHAKMLVSCLPTMVATPLRA